MLLQQTSSTRAVFARHVWCLQVFSQWKDALLVVSKALSAHSIGHVSLTGGRQGKVPSLEPSTSSMEASGKVLLQCGIQYRPGWVVPYIG